MDEQNENKNGLAEKGKNTIKNKVKKKLILIGIKIAVVVILIVAAASILLAVFNAVGDAVQSIISAVVDFFTIDENGAIDVKDELVDTIVNGIAELGVDIDGLKLLGDIDYNNPSVQEENEKALRKYIKQFYETQAITETINTKDNWAEEQILNGGKPYGNVYVYRAEGTPEILDSSTAKNKLEFVKYEEMERLKREGKSDEILKKVAITPEGKMVVASVSTIKQTSDSTVISNNTTIDLIEIDYKKSISQYTTGMNFFLYLAMTSQNPEFVVAVTDLVKKGRIEIIVVDVKRESRTQKTTTYTENIKSIKRGSDDEPITKEDGSYETEITRRQIQHTEVLENQQTDTALAVTYVRTWYGEQQITYNKETRTSSTGPNVQREEDSEEPEDDDPRLETDGNVVWITNKRTSIQNNSTMESYKQGTSQNVIDKLGEKGCQGIKDLNGNGQVDNNEIVDDDSRFLGLLDNKFKIPNSTRYDSAAGNIVSGAELFFYLLQKDSTTQNIEEIMRYALYKYTGKNYGITELNINLFPEEEFKLITGGNGIGRFGQISDLREYAAQFGGSPRLASGFYKMYDDGVGYATVGGADLLWSANQSRFSIPGQVSEDGVTPIDVPNVKDYVNSKLLKNEDGTIKYEGYAPGEVSALNIYISAEVLNKIGDEVQQGHYNYVESVTSELNLSKQQLYALTELSLNFGGSVISDFQLPWPEQANNQTWINTEDVKRRTFCEVYKDGAKLYEEGSWQHNKYVWDNWWVFLGYMAADRPTPGLLFGRDATFETYVKGSFKVQVYGRNYMFFSEEQLALYPSAIRTTILRNTTSDEDTFSMKNGSLHGEPGTFTTDEASIGVTGYYISSKGRRHTILKQSEITPANGFTGDPETWRMKCNRAACAIVASGYSDENKYELADTLNNHYDGQYGVIPGDSYWGLYGLTVRNSYVIAYDKTDYISKLQQQLLDGGYAVLWLNSNPADQDTGGIYLGKSGILWTSLYHWVAVLDYTEENGIFKMCIGDARGITWVPIDEFTTHGVANMIFINEK